MLGKPVDLGSSPGTSSSRRLQKPAVLVRGVSRLFCPPAPISFLLSKLGSWRGQPLRGAGLPTTYRGVGLPLSILSASERVTLWCKVR